MNKDILLLLPEYAATFMAQFREAHPKWEMTYIPNEKLSEIIIEKDDSDKVIMPSSPTLNTRRIMANLGVTSHCTIELFTKIESLPDKVYVLHRAGDPRAPVTVYTKLC